MVIIIYNSFLDIYVMMVSDVHNVCKKGFYIAILSTNVETNNPEKELDPAFELVGPILEKFITVKIIKYNNLYRFLMFTNQQMMVKEIIFSYLVHLIHNLILREKQYKF